MQITQLEEALKELQQILSVGQERHQSDMDSLEEGNRSLLEQLELKESECRILTEETEKKAETIKIAEKNISQLKEEIKAKVKSVQEILSFFPSNPITV